MLRRDWAHGDLKPENIIVTARGLRLVDFDASYLPALAGEPSPELGTAAYQHPARTVRDYDRHLDDFPAALLSTALHALALDPGLYGRTPLTDGLLFVPKEVVDGSSAVWRECLELFSRAVGGPLSIRRVGKRCAWRDSTPSSRSATDAPWPNATAAATMSSEP